ncbi:hypothetical protein R5R35_001271 [Gryllus longicercus]|uniref:Accessory gland protein n=1 Tax=Gryllus longicercus TaxID=2509291 RepID=A0AAN9VJ24_9ORTH
MATRFLGPPSRLMVMFCCVCLTSVLKTARCASSFEAEAAQNLLAPCPGKDSGVFASLGSRLNNIFLGFVLASCVDGLKAPVLVLEVKPLLGGVRQKWQLHFAFSWLP